MVSDITILHITVRHSADYADYTKHQIGQHIWHLILYRHREIAIQRAFVYFGLANS